MLYVFMCKRGSCLSKRSRSGLRIFRSQLPLHNDIYDNDGILLESAAPVVKQTCSVCGLYAPSRCGKCQKRHYCSKDHQALDWTQGKHKDYCESSLDHSSRDLNTITTTSHPNPVFNRWVDACALFPCHELEQDEEPEKNSSTSSTDNDILLDQQPLSTTNSSNRDDDAEAEEEALQEEQETQTDVDKTFLKFQKRISLAPDQVLRYGRVLPYGNEEPLWACEEGRPTIADVPACEHCGAERTFEFQITPQILVHLGLDHKDPSAIDFGTVVFYTCSKHCKAANDGQYCEEWFFKQDFSMDGVGNGTSQKELSLEGGLATAESSTTTASTFTASDQRTDIDFSPKR